MKNLVTPVLLFLLVACSGFTSCKPDEVAGLFRMRLGNEVVVLNLGSDGTGSLAFNKEAPHTITWEFDSLGPQYSNTMACHRRAFLSRWIIGLLERST